MTYNELLQQDQWFLKCNKIINRDHYTCQDCGNIGYHDGGTFSEFASVDELNAFFKEWKIRGYSIKEFLELKEKPIPLRYHIKELDFPIVKRIKNKYLCSVYLEGYWALDLMDIPSGLNLVSDKELNNVPADLYYYNTLDLVNITHDRFKDMNGSVFYLEFEDCFLSHPHVNIEYRIRGYIDDQIIEDLSVNISTGNQFLSMDLCSPCMKYFKGLNVHHRYYIHGKAPWEYENEALVTLCEDCHKKRHLEKNVPVYNAQMQEIASLRPCDRCGGSGYLPQYSYYQGGVCFKCGGEGVILG